MQIKRHANSPEAQILTDLSMMAPCLIMPSVCPVPSSKAVDFVTWTEDGMTMGMRSLMIGRKEAMHVDGNIRVTLGQGEYDTVSRCDLSLILAWEGESELGGRVKFSFPLTENPAPQHNSLPSLDCEENIGDISFL